jgi:integrase
LHYTRGRGEKPYACGRAEGIKASADLPKDFRPFHGLRHNFGVTLANSGKLNISEISEALTHKNLTFTKERYARFSPDTLAKIGNSAASILNVPIEPAQQKAGNA